MKCLFVGTGGSVNSESRHNTSLFIESETASLLIDCNGVCVQRLTAAGIAFELIEHVFLTHEHIDHVAALNNLLHQMWVKGCLYSQTRRTTLLHIYGNQRTIERARLLIDAVGLQAHPGIFPIELHPLDQDGGTLSINDLKFSYFAVNHGPTSCYGLDFSGLVYSGDTEPCSAIYKRLKNGDVLIHDCNKIDAAINPEHTTWAQIEALWPDLPLVTLYLVHLPIMSKSQEAEFSTLLKEQYSGKIILGNDGHAIRINRY